MPGQSGHFTHFDAAGQARMVDVADKAVTKRVARAAGRIVMLPATLASILPASRLKTGLYTSPHLVRLNERIRVNGEEISDASFAELHGEVDRVAERLVEELVRNDNCRLIRLLALETGVPYNDARCYPVYAKCIELGVPVGVNVGVPGPAVPAKLQHPLAVDEVKTHECERPVLRSETPAGVIQEIEGLLLAHYVEFRDSIDVLS